MQHAAGGVVNRHKCLTYKIYLKESRNTGWQVQNYTCENRKQQQSQITTVNSYKFVTSIVAVRRYCQVPARSRVKFLVHLPAVLRCAPMLAT